MNIKFPVFVPALKTLSTGGSIIRGPVLLDAASGRVNGLYLSSVRTTLVPELFGPFTYADFHVAPSLIGYRINISLDFGLVDVDIDNPWSYGLPLLSGFYSDGFANDAVGLLWFNLYADNAQSPWRVVYPTSSWSATPAGGKQSRGFEVKMELTTRDLLTTFPDSWAMYKW